MKQLIILIATLVCCDFALACSCGDITTTGSYSRASNVFRARIESVDIVPVPKHIKDVGWRLPTGSNPKSRVVQARFELLEKYKGSPQLLNAVYTNRSGASCGVNIDDGSEYIFFADAEGIVSHCGGSTPVWPSSKEFKELTKSLKRLRSQQLDNEKIAHPKVPEKSRK